MRKSLGRGGASSSTQVFCGNADGYADLLGVYSCITQVDNSGWTCELLGRGGLSFSMQLLSLVVPAGTAYDLCQGFCLWLYISWGGQMHALPVIRGAPSI